MRVRWKNLRFFFILSFTAWILLGYQNCAPTRYSLGDEGTQSLSSLEVINPPDCFFNGVAVSNGQSVQAFLMSSVPAGQSCQAQTRTCNSGVLSGSYQFASCQVATPASCLFNGVTIAHGAQVAAFRESSVGFGASCVSENRVCDNGALSGSYPFASCAPEEPESCLFNGRTLVHGQSVIAFPTSSVPTGQSCVGQTRTCNDGVLSGTNPYSSCQVNLPASCLVDGIEYAHGQSALFYEKPLVSSGESCRSETRVCNNGSMSGSFAETSCEIDPGWVASLVSLVRVKPAGCGGGLTSQTTCRAELCHWSRNNGDSLAWYKDCAGTCVYNGGVAATCPTTALINIPADSSLLPPSTGEIVKTFYKTAPGCGAGLSDKATCQTRQCGGSRSNGDSIQWFYDCAGTCVYNSPSKTCANTSITADLGPSDPMLEGSYNSIVAFMQKTYREPSGCGGSLTFQTSCKTPLCRVSRNNGDSIQWFYDCAGNCVQNTTSRTCATTPASQ